MRLDGLRAASEEFARGLDPTTIGAAQAARMVRELAAIQGILAAAAARVAARAAESSAWRATGATSPVNQIARDAGVSAGQARDLVATGQRLEALPVVRQAAERGELSAQQAVLVADAAAVDPESAGRLLRTARSGSLGELRAECLAVKASVEDMEARRARIHAARALRTFTDRDGTGHLHLTENPEVIAEAVALIAPARERLFRAARAEGRRERAEALDADAFVATLRQAGSPAGAKTRLRQAKLLVRADLDALLRGHPLRGETCEVMGQPVAVSAVEDMLAAGGFVAGIVTHGRQVTGVAHLGRAPTAYQDSALEWLYPSCAVHGCGRRVRLERDHREAWASRKVTLLDLLDLLCSHHHGLKTRENWALVDGHGAREFVPPDHPRHPRHTSPAA